MRTCFIGLGYIGLPTAIVAANHEINVVGVDINPTVVDTVNKGSIHIAEPGLQKLCKEVVASGYLRAYNEPQPSDVYVVVVPTPFKENHKPDISYIEQATRSIIPLLKKDDLYIIESTSPVGTTEKMMDLIYKERPDLIGELNIAYCPERVLPGNIIYELVHNDRVIGGINEKSTNKAIGFYSKFVKGKLHRTNSRTAELCKLTENASRDVQIAFANELSIICDKVGVNVWELISLANKHPRVNILSPGCGVGGHCIAVDPYFISSEFPDEAKVIGLAREINDFKSDWCAQKIQFAINEFIVTHKKSPVLALMGLAFKPNIDDLRESPALYIARKINSTVKDAEILIVEPNIKEHKLFQLTNYVDAYNRADIVVFLVSHNEFKSLAVDQSKQLIDFCGILEQ